MKKNRESIIETLKSNAPIIYGITMTMDMGYEFSAIAEEGLIYPELGRHIPDWWDDDEIDERELTTRKNSFLQQFDIVPWRELSTEDLEDILTELQESED